LAIVLGGFIVQRNLSGPAKPDAKPPRDPSPQPVVIDDIALPAYVILDSAFGEQSQAQRRLVELNRWGYSNTGFFWVPNFKYLSGKPLYQVYVGPFAAEETAVAELCAYNRKMKTVTYGVRLSTEPGRREFRCRGG
jgi:hypothetical protein